jgi:hypothetical protein
MASLSRDHCVYCGNPATTSDHVPPKLLLVKPYPKNMGTVPSCSTCNQGASLDEQYFLALLGQFSESPAIAKQISEGGTIDRALARAPGFEGRLLEALSIDEETGMVVIRPEMDRVHLIVRKIAFGLFVRRFGQVPSIEVIGPVGVFPYLNEDEVPMPFRAVTFTSGGNPKTWTDVQQDTFSYIFVQDPQDGGSLWCIMDIHSSLWCAIRLPYPNGASEIQVLE